MIKLPVILLLLPALLFACSPSVDQMYSKAYRLEQKKKYKEAIVVYDKISKKYPKFQDAVFLKGCCFLSDSNYSKALECFDAVLRKKGAAGNESIVLEMNPDSPFASEEDRRQVTLNEVYYQMAIANYNIDSLRASYKMFKHCSRNKFNEGNCYVWQGLIWIRYDSINRACELFQKAKWLNESEADRFISEYCSK